MPPSSQSQKNIISNDNQERIDDLSHHSELPSFELEAVHDALDHAFDHFKEQNEEEIKKINRQTRVHEKLIADVSTYKGRLQSFPNTAVKKVLQQKIAPTNNIPTLVRESLEEAIADKQKDNNDRHQHHKFTEKHSLNSPTSADEKKGDAISSTTNAEKKKMLILIILLSLIVIILGIVIITH